MLIYSGKAPGEMSFCSKNVWLRKSCICAPDVVGNWFLYVHYFLKLGPQVVFLAFKAVFMLQLIIKLSIFFSVFTGVEQEIARESNAANLKMEIMKQQHPKLYQGVLWLRENKHLFQDEVFEPMYTQVLFHVFLHVTYLKSEILISWVRSSLPVLSNFAKSIAAFVNFYLFYEHNLSVHTLKNCIS